MEPEDFFFMGASVADMMYGTLKCAVGLGLVHHAARNSARFLGRHYITRTSLRATYDRRTPSDWDRIWKARDDRAFINTIGIDVATFVYMLTFFQGPFNSISAYGGACTRRGRRAVTAVEGLAIILYYLTSMGYEKRLCAVCVNVYIYYFVRVLRSVQVHVGCFSKCLPLFASPISWLSVFF